MKPLVVIPVFMHRPDHTIMLRKCLESLRSEKSNITDVDIMMVDDCSPLPGKSVVLQGMADEFGCELFEKPENSGYSKTINVGLMKALIEKRVAVTVNMDIEFMDQCPEWLAVGLDDPAAIVGGRLLYSNGFIQHGGVYFSLLHKYWDHLYRFAPFNLPEANIRRNVPVTGALQIIKPECMSAIGLYDENFKMAYEDVDYCCRAMLPLPHGAGLEVAYNPGVLAYHHESAVRGGVKKYSDWHDESFAYFMQKYAEVPLTQFVPPVDRARNRTLGDLHPKISAIPQVFARSTGGV